MYGYGQLGVHYPAPPVFPGYPTYNPYTPQIQPQRVNQDYEIKANTRKMISKKKLPNDKTEVLMKVFQKTPYVNINQRTELADALDLTTETVKNWFQNCRNKLKKSIDAASDMVDVDDSLGEPLAATENFKLFDFTTYLSPSNHYTNSPSSLQYLTEVCESYKQSQQKQSLDRDTKLQSSLNTPTCDVSNSAPESVHSQLKITDVKTLAPSKLNDTKSKPTAPVPSSQSVGFTPLPPQLYHARSEPGTPLQQIYANVEPLDLTTQSKDVQGGSMTPTMHNYKYPDNAEMQPQQLHTVDQRQHMNGYRQLGVDSFPEPQAFTGYPMHPINPFNVSASYPGQHTPCSQPDRVNPGNNGHELKHKTKETRKNKLTEEQVKVLNRVFKKTQYVDINQRTVLAASLGVKEQNIKTWFRYKRTIRKKYSGVCADMTDVDNGSSEQASSGTVDFTTIPSLSNHYCQSSTQSQIQDSYDSRNSNITLSDSDSEHSLHIDLPTASMLNDFKTEPVTPTASSESFNFTILPSQLYDVKSEPGTESFELPTVHRTTSFQTTTESSGTFDFPTIPHYACSVKSEVQPQQQGTHTFDNILSSAVLKSELVHSSQTVYDEYILHNIVS